MQFADARRTNELSEVWATRSVRRLVSIVALAMLGFNASAATDPLRSPAWDAMVQRHLDGGRVEFDDRVEVIMPESAEDPLSVPVQVRVNGIDGIEEIRVIADLNPLPLILSYVPIRAEPVVSFRFKVEQSTPVRAAARTTDGIWHVGGGWLTAAGGGCTAPSYGTGEGLWRDELGNVTGKLWPREGDSSRLRFRIMHPMDTGLAPGIPVFHIEELRFLDAEGGELARLKTYEPVSENPVLSLDLKTRDPVQVVGRDIQGNRVEGRISP